MNCTHTHHLDLRNGYFWCGGCGAIEYNDAWHQPADARIHAHCNRRITL